MIVGAVRRRRGEPPFAQPSDHRDKSRCPQLRPRSFAGLRKSRGGGVVRAFNPPAPCALPEGARGERRVACTGALLRGAEYRASPQYCFRLGGCRPAPIAGRSSAHAGRHGCYVSTDPPRQFCEPRSPEGVARAAARNGQRASDRQSRRRTPRPDLSTSMRQTGIRQCPETRSKLAGFPSHPSPRHKGERNRDSVHSI